MDVLIQSRKCERKGQGNLPLFLSRLDYERRMPYIDSERRIAMLMIWTNLLIIVGLVLTMGCVDLLVRYIKG